MLYIGIDLGTSAVKLILMDETGKIHNTVSREYPIFYPHSGWSEQNPEDWYAQVIEGILKLTANIDKSLLFLMKMITLFVRQFYGMTEELPTKQIT